MSKKSLNGYTLNERKGEITRIYYFFHHKFRFERNVLTLILSRLLMIVFLLEARDEGAGCVALCFSSFSTSAVIVETIFSRRSKLLKAIKFNPNSNNSNYFKMMGNSDAQFLQNGVDASSVCWFWSSWTLRRLTAAVSTGSALSSSLSNTTTSASSSFPFGERWGGVLCCWVKAFRLNWASLKIWIVLS